MLARKLVPIEWIIDEQYTEEFTEQELLQAIKECMCNSKLDSKGCWVWENSKWSTDNRGCGMIKFPHRRDSIAAYRVMFLLFNDMIWGEPQVRHLCGNPKCINPQHLSCGDTEDNGLDRKFHTVNGIGALAPVDWQQLGERNTKSVAVVFQENFGTPRWTLVLQYLYDNNWISF